MAACKVRESVWFFALSSGAVRACVLLSQSSPKQVEQPALQLRQVRLSACLPPFRRFAKSCSPAIQPPLVLQENCLPLARYVLERKTYREDPAVIVLMEFGHSNLHASADAEVKSLREWKRAQDESGCQEDLFFPVQGAARPVLRVLLKHRPDFPLNLVVDRGIENEGSPEEVGAAGGKVCGNGGLNIPGPDALGGCKSRRENRVTDAVWSRSRRQGATKKESYEVVPAAFRCGKRPILHLEQQIAKSICRGGLVCQIVGRKDADFQPGCGNDFKAF